MWPAALIHVLSDADNRARANARKRPPKSRWARRVRLRPMGRGETETVQEIFAGLGSRSRMSRFLSPHTRLTSAELSRLTAVDGREHVALVAESAQGRPVGVARFVRDPEDRTSAEVAVAVVDRWQGRGIGTRLASALAARAREVGVHRFTMVMLSDNEAALRLMHRLPGEVERLALDGGNAEFAITLGRHGASGRYRRTLDGLPR